MVLTAIHVNAKDEFVHLSKNSILVLLLVVGKFDKHLCQLQRHARVVVVFVHF